MKKLIFKIIIFLISLFSININVLANDGKIYNFPLDYIEKNTKGYASWDAVYSAYSIDSSSVKKDLGFNCSIAKLSKLTTLK